MEPTQPRWIFQRNYSGGERNHRYPLLTQQRCLSVLSTSVVQQPSFWFPLRLTGGQTQAGEDSIGGFCLVLSIVTDARAQRGRERWVLSGGRDESEEKKLASGERKSAGWRIWRRKLDGYQALEDKVERARYRAQAQRAGDNKDDYLNVRFPQVTNAVKWPPLPHNQLQQTDTGL